MPRRGVRISHGEGTKPGRKRWAKYPKRLHVSLSEDTYARMFSLVSKGGQSTSDPNPVDAARACVEFATSPFTEESNFVELTADHACVWCGKRTGETLSRTLDHPSLPYLVLAVIVCCKGCRKEVEITAWDVPPVDTSRLMVETQTIHCRGCGESKAISLEKYKTMKKKSYLCPNCKQERSPEEAKEAFG